MPFIAPPDPPKGLSDDSNAVIRSNPISERLTIGKISVGVFLGIIVAAVVLGAAYHFGIQVPHQRATHVAAARRLFDADINGRAFDTVTRLTTDQLESQLKEEEPSSPCNSLTGETFAACDSLDNLSAQRSYVAAAGQVKAPK